MTTYTATKLFCLIEELLSDPVDFENRGRGNELLNFYGDGISLDSLRPLLSHHHVSVRGTAMFVVAELGVGSRPLLDSITPLADDSDPHIAYDAMESVFLCATDAFAGCFIVVIRQLEKRSGTLRQLAMDLVAKAHHSQLLVAKHLCDELGVASQVHATCLQKLVESESIEVTDIHQMLDSSTELVRIYGAVLAKRTMARHPRAIEYAASNTNSDVRQFALEVVAAQ